MTADRKPPRIIRFDNGPEPNIRGARYFEAKTGPQRAPVSRHDGAQREEITEL